MTLLGCAILGGLLRTTNWGSLEKGRRKLMKDSRCLRGGQTRTQLSFLWMQFPFPPASQTHVEYSFSCFVFTGLVQGTTEVRCSHFSHENCWLRILFAALDPPFPGTHHDTYPTRLPKTCQTPHTHYKHTCYRHAFLEQLRLHNYT